MTRMEGGAGVRIVRHEKRRRGLFGWLFLGLFWLWNLLMAAWVAASLSVLGNVEASSEAARTGAAMGGFLAFGMILAIWAAGVIVLGALAMLTRGRKIVTEERFER